MWVLKCFGWWNSSPRSEGCTQQELVWSKSDLYQQVRENTEEETWLVLEVISLFLSKLSKISASVLILYHWKFVCSKMKYPSRLYRWYLLNLNPSLETFSVYVCACVAHCLWCYQWFRLFVLIVGEDQTLLLHEHSNLCWPAIFDALFLFFVEVCLWSVLSIFPSFTIFFGQ